LDCSTVGAEAVIEANNRDGAGLFREHNGKAEAACPIKRHSSPVNVVGGYKFPNAPAVDLRPDKVAELQMLAELYPSDWRPVSPTQPPITDDLRIPAFLRRAR
jgi:hypothetical protein